MDQQALYDARLELTDFCIEAFHDTPDPDFVARLLDGGLETPAESVNDHLDAAFDYLREFVAAREGEDPEAVADDLAVEYTRVFVGPRPPVLAHETFYRDDKDYLGKGLAEVEASYGAASWSVPDDYGEESDFVAAELLFVRNLVDRQRRGKEEAVGFERVFLDEHLTHWVEDLLADLDEATDEPFYLAAGHALVGLVELERDLVG